LQVILVQLRVFSRKFTGIDRTDHSPVLSLP
jgi:hypothetical protein